MGKKKLRCPVCGFQRLVDANEKITIEMFAKNKIPLKWNADFYMKCSKCCNQIGIKKVS